MVNLLGVFHKTTAAYLKLDDCQHRHILNNTQRDLFVNLEQRETLVCLKETILFV